MLKAPNLGGGSQLRAFIDDLGEKRALKILGVHRSTVNRWLNDAPSPPTYALYALYWETSWGRSEVLSEWSGTQNILTNDRRLAEDRARAAETALFEARQAQLAAEQRAAWAERELIEQRLATEAAERLELRALRALTLQGGDTPMQRRLALVDHRQSLVYPPDQPNGRDHQHIEQRQHFQNGQHPISLALSASRPLPPPDP